MVNEMRSVDELLRDLKFVAKYEHGREYNEIDVGQLLDDAIVRIQSLVADVEDISRRYRSIAKDSVNLTILLGFLNRYLPRECDTCKHWVIGDETPMKCEVGGCEDLKKSERIGNGDISADLILYFREFLVPLRIWLSFC